MDVALLERVILLLLLIVFSSYIVIQKFIKRSPKEAKPLQRPRTRAPVTRSSQAFLFSKSARWYWAIHTIVVFTVIFMFLPEMFPLSLIRYVLGTLFILYIPGYVCVKSLYVGKELGFIEQNALSIGISLSLVPILGFILDFTLWGFDMLISTVLVLVIITVGLSTYTIIREASNTTQQSAS